MTTTLVSRCSVIPAVPWWRVGVMWLFVGGLGAVVVGSFALLATALDHVDVVLPQDAARVELPPAAQRVVLPITPASPALQARNHSATPRPDAQAR